MIQAMERRGRKEKTQVKNQNKIFKLEWGFYQNIKNMVKVCGENH